MSTTAMHAPLRIDIECTESVCSTPEPSPGNISRETVKSFFSDPPSPRATLTSAALGDDEGESVFLRYLRETEKKPPAPRDDPALALNSGIWASSRLGSATFGGNDGHGSLWPAPAAANPSEPAQAALLPAGTGYDWPPQPAAQPQREQQQQQPSQSSQATSASRISSLLQMLVQSDATASGSDHREPSQEKRPQPPTCVAHPSLTPPSAPPGRPSPLELALAMAHLTDSPKQKRREKPPTQPAPPPQAAEEELAVQESIGESILAAFARLQPAKKAPQARTPAGLPAGIFQQLQSQRSWGAGQDPAMRPVCLDHLKGTCHKARKSCKFAHPPVTGSSFSCGPADPFACASGRVCEVWACTGFCKFGNKCKFDHPPLMGQLQYTPAVTKKMMEFAFAKQCPY